tara:strand:- start:5612 stop:6535 length:924 start_codon:yes stop_codon:yes gene_type:complete
MPFIQTKQLKIHYEQQINGDIPIVLLHGNFASWHYWEPFLQQLAKGYKAYAPDFRGCGSSQVTDAGYNIQTLSDDLLEFVNALQLEKFHLVAHSLGGAVAQQFAGDHPKRITTLTLVAPSPAEGLKILDKTPSATSFFSAGNVFNFLDLVGLKRKTLAHNLKKSMPAINDKTDSFQRLLDDAMSMDIKALNGFLQSLKDWSGTHLLSRFNFPVLIAYGLLDPVVPLRSLENMQQLIPNCRLSLFKRIGHAPQLEDPLAFNSLVTSFIQGAPLDLKQQAAPEPEKTGFFSLLVAKLKRIFKKTTTIGK